jgi:hypothetical protein
VALAMPAYALAGAAAVLTLRSRVPAVAVAVVCCAALLATQPDVAWGVGGQMRAVRYPPDWAAMAQIVNAAPAPVAVLPPDSMRQFGWAGTAPVLDPLPRWVRADVLTTGDLNIGDQTVPGEGGRARDVQALLLGGASVDRLRGMGVGWVVVEGQGSLRLPVAYRDEDLTLYRVGGSAPSADGRGLMIAVHLVWLALLVAGLGGMLTARFRPRSRWVRPGRLRRRR